MVFKGLLYALLAICITRVAALDLVNSKWIWSDKNFLTVNPHVVRDFRRVFAAPAGKVPSTAHIIITADNNYTLFVNGETIGRGSDWVVSQEYCVKLNSTCDNVFAVAVENQGTTPNPAAFIAAIEVDFTDGTSDTFITDANWRVNVPTPGFEKITFDDSTWPNAYVAGNSNSPPWIVPHGPYDASTSTLADSLWVWTDEIPPNSPLAYAPVGSRAFRKKIDLPSGSLATGGSIIFDADNEYQLYINGKYIGSGNDWQVAQRWKFTLDYATDDIVIAVNATNTLYEAGIIATIALNTVNCNCSATPIYATDGSWKFSLTVPANFADPNYDDSAWKKVIIEGPYGVQPWGSVPIKNAN